MSVPQCLSKPKPHPVCLCYRVYQRPNHTLYVCATVSINDQTTPCMSVPQCLSTPKPHPVCLCHSVYQRPNHTLYVCATVSINAQTTPVCLCHSVYQRPNHAMMFSKIRYDVLSLTAVIYQLHYSHKARFSSVHTCTVFFMKQLINFINRPQVSNKNF